MAAPIRAGIDVGGTFTDAALLDASSRLPIPQGGATRPHLRAGVRSVREKGAQQRASLYDLRLPRPAPLVPRELRLEVRERIGPAGEGVRRLESAGGAAAAPGGPRVGAPARGRGGAGADPGPAAYGRGGEDATVTDAHVVLGTLDPAHFLGGRGGRGPPRGPRGAARTAAP